MLALFGLIGLLQALRTWRRAVAAQNWSTATGRVSASTVDQAWTPEKTDYWIEYEYTVDGRQYTGKQISLAPPMRPQPTKQRARLSRYAVGTSVAVYYDPRDPQRAVLERHVPWGQILLLVVGSLIGLAWAALVVSPAF